MSNLKKLKSDQKKIWRWLSKHSDPELGDYDNKENAGSKLNIKLDRNNAFCLYCEYDDKNDEDNCDICPIVLKYKKKCTDLGYDTYKDFRTPENARKFYENAIKGT